MNEKYINGRIFGKWAEPDQYLMAPSGERTCTIMHILGKGPPKYSIFSEIPSES